MNIKKIAFAAVIAAVYAVLTMVLAPISYGAVQMRLSELLCILPFFFPACTAGLFIGCLISNLLSAFGILDIVFGSMATLIAALITMYMGKISRKSIITKIIACLAPVVCNAVIVGGIIAFSTVPGEGFLPAFLLNALQVGVGEFVVTFVVGLPTMLLIPKTDVFKKLSAQLGDIK